MREETGRSAIGKAQTILRIALIVSACWLLPTGVSQARVVSEGTGASSEMMQQVFREGGSVVHTALSERVIERFGNPPEITDEPLSEDVRQAMDIVFVNSPRTGAWGEDQSKALQTISESGDVRLTWLVSDLMRIAGSEMLRAALAAAADELLKQTIDKANSWGDTVDHLIAWDIPAPPEYLDYKRSIYTLIVPEWDKLFTEGDIDWRHVSWGGVRIDDRAFDTTDDPCNCIPAADNPEVTDVAGADWLDDDDIVFGIEINGESRAYPRQIMEVREMVNDTLGGRDLGIPYCTLCGSAQAYFTDDVPNGVERPVLRTSGLLIRSNKVMYDLSSYSVFDTFRGDAVTGPLADKNVSLNQAGVVTTTWGDWKKAYPKTTVLAEYLALGRDFDFRNNRDANGPIFPIGDVDPRLPVQEDIVGVITKSGEAIAFQKNVALAALKNGDKISVGSISLELKGGGIKAVDEQGNDMGAHQAFWFAWSQFHPDTQLWTM